MSAWVCAGLDRLRRPARRSRARRSGGRPRRPARRSQWPMQGARTTRTAAGIEPVPQGREQRLGAQQLAGQAVADPHGERRRRRLALLHHIEMGVEGRDLVDLGLRQAHLLGERRQMRGREMAVAVLDQVQMLDQQVAPARAVAEQGPHLLERAWHRPGGPWAVPRRAAGRRPDVLADLACALGHASLSSARRRPARSRRPVPAPSPRHSQGGAGRQRGPRASHREIGSQPLPPVHRP